MNPGDEGFLVRARFSPPAVEPMQVVANRRLGGGSLIEVSVQPRFPFRPSERVQLLVKSPAGRLQAAADVVCWSGKAACFAVAAETRTELRGSERVASDLPARIKLIDGDVEGTVTDISRGGLRILVGVRPRLTTLVLDMTVADDVEVELLGRVVSIKEAGEQFALHVAVERVLKVLDTDAA